MNFFAQQDLARRNTRVLVAVYLAAVLGLILLTNAAVAAFLYVDQGGHLGRSGDTNFLSYFSWQRFGGIGLTITGAIAVVVFFKWIQLSTGGKAVAESMGGTRILPQTRDRAERRCLNVVDEMALAAGMPVPHVYVLNDERGINAFAAGITPADAVIGVTRGTITQLERSELQGVIGHEFSHILNGDMRLNIRLAALLKGITFVGDVGHVLLRSGRTRSGRSSGNGGAIMPLLGLGLWLVGWLGSLIAGFIKAAISRQKEYLADASAVQYTRDPDGIANALKVIGGYTPGTLVHAARAIDLSHIFFGQIQHRLWQVFATHPPLRERIRRIDKGWDGRFIERKTIHYEAEPSRPGYGEAGVGRAGIVAAAGAFFAVDEDVSDEAAHARAQDSEIAQRESLPVGLLRFSREPLGAQAIALSLLLQESAALESDQVAILNDSAVQGLAEMVATVQPSIHDLDPPFRLPLLELCIPALKAMSQGQYRRFKDAALRLIQSDSKTTLHEWCFFQLIRHYLDPEYVRVGASRPRYRSLKKVAYHLRVVLSVMAYESSGPADEHFRSGIDELGLPALTLMPRDQATVATFSRAVHELADLYPLLKPKVLKALLSVARCDGEVVPRELEVIHSIAAVMDCPVPPADGPASLD